MKFLLLFLFSVVTSFSQIIRVNIGGPSYVDAGGRTWEADNYCSGSTFASVLPITSITGTSDPTLYMTGRTDPSAFSCAFSLPDGIYQVTLKFADVLPILTTPRLFNVSVQGRVVLSQFNINSLAGRGAAYDRSFNTTVLGNSPLTVLFSQVSGAPVIQAIEILYLYSVPAGDTFPSTCSIGQLFIKTNAATSQKIYVCETLNTWVQQIGSAIMTTGVGVPSGACTAGALFANTTPSPHDYYGCGPSGTWQRFVMTTDGTDGKVCLQGVASGQACLAVPDAAGAPNDILLPTTTGTNTYVLSTNGANPQQTSWVAQTTITTASGPWPYAGLGIALTTTIAQSANIPRYLRVVAPYSMSISKFNFYIDTADAGKYMGMAIYDSSCNRLTASTSTGQVLTATGFFSVGLGGGALTLTQGSVYYVAFASDGTLSKFAITNSQTAMAGALAVTETGASSAYFNGASVISVAAGTITWPASCGARTLDSTHEAVWGIFLP